MTKEELKTQKALGIIPKGAGLFYCGTCRDQTPHTYINGENKRNVTIYYIKCYFCNLSTPYYYYKH